MVKKTSILVASLLIGSLSVGVFSSAAYAFGPGNANPTMQEQAQQLFNQMHKRSHQQAKMQKAKRGGLGLIGIACDERAAQRLEGRLDKIGKALELSKEQQTLFDELRMAALTSQTQFLDVCTKPERGKKTGLVEKIKIRNNNMSAMVEASNSVLPQLEAFLNSLSDEQKAKLKKAKPLAYKNVPPHKY